MPSLIVTDRAGAERAVEGRAGDSVMEIIRNHGFDDLLALCGGCLACATCHVYVDDEDFARLPTMSEDEDALLDSSEHRTATSRLSCQIEMSDAFEGLRVTIAPED